MRRLQQDPTAENFSDQEGDSPGFPGDDDAFETFEIYRVTCPDCRQPIALLADEDTLPEHALCPTPWNPFGLTVCQGSGRAVSEAPETEDTLDAQEQDAAMLLTLPEGLDWRRQPFSHIGGPGTRPIRVPRMRHGA
ncbi:hypothetical protein SL103_21515 [Streptomyces lydicus]|uniref:Uncharacterized protein n=2 Tax=Streptomyces lydicus TaxID=47763 RepID=A0A1D7VXD2_9ACTN|nr:hypothetical protein SL103_21515 [Streptomyces lydicus]